MLHLPPRYFILVARQSTIIRRFALSDGFCAAAIRRAFLDRRRYYRR